MNQQTETGSQVLGKMINHPTKKLDPISVSDKLYKVTYEISELVCSCPVTGQPDIYKGSITIYPSGIALETKSLKLYLWSFQAEAHFAEDLACIIMQDIFKVCNPSKILVSLEQNIRGGIVIKAESGA